MTLTRLWLSEASLRWRQLLCYCLRRYKYNAKIHRQARHGPRGWYGSQDGSSNTQYWNYQSGVDNLSFIWYAFFARQGHVISHILNLIIRKIAAHNNLVLLSTCLVQGYARQRNSLAVISLAMFQARFTQVLPLKQSLWRDRLKLLYIVHSMEMLSSDQWTL